MNGKEASYAVHNIFYFNTTTVLGMTPGGLAKLHNQLLMIKYKIHP